MSSEITSFIINFLGARNYPTDGMGEDTQLGKWGLDLLEIEISDLSVRLQENYGVAVAEYEIRDMTIGQLSAAVAERQGT